MKTLCNWCIHSESYHPNMKCNHHKKIVTKIIKKCDKYVPKDRKMFVETNGKITRI